MSSDIHALSGAYAVDALSDAERAEFEAHLSTCAACRDEVDSLREAATRLGETAAVPPPPAVRDAVLAGIAAIRPLPPMATVPTAATGEGEAEVIPLRRRWLTGLVAAAAAVVALAAGAVVWHPWSDGTTQHSLADQVLAAPDATHAHATIGDAEVTLVRSASLGKAVVVSDDLPVLPADKVYEVWLQSPSGEFVPAGLLPPSTSQKFLILGDAGAATGAGITIEPAGGSQAPTTVPLALFPFGSTA